MKTISDIYLLLLAQQEGYFSRDENHFAHPKAFIRQLEALQDEGADEGTVFYMTYTSAGISRLGISQVDVKLCSLHVKKEAVVDFLLHHQQTADS